MFNNMSLKNKLLSGGVGPMILVVVVGIVCWLSLNSLLNNSGWVEHTYRVIAKANEISKLVVDMETGERGFSLRARKNISNPLFLVRKGSKNRIKDLKNTVSDNPAQVKRLENIEAKIQSWFQDVANPEMALRREVVKGEEAVKEFKRLQSRIVVNKFSTNFALELLILIRNSRLKETTGRYHTEKF